MSFGPKFKFHSNIKKKTSLKELLPFYRDIFINWKIQFSSSPETPACFLSQFFWLSNYIQIEDNPVCLTKFAAKNTDFYLTFLKKVISNLGMTLKLNTI